MRSNAAWQVVNTALWQFVETVYILHASLCYRQCPCEDLFPRNSGGSSKILMNSDMLWEHVKAYETGLLGGQLEAYEPYRSWKLKAVGELISARLLLGTFWHVACIVDLLRKPFKVCMPVCADGSQPPNWHAVPTFVSCSMQTETSLQCWLTLFLVYDNFAYLNHDGSANLPDSSSYENCAYERFESYLQCWLTISLVIREFCIFEPCWQC